MAESQAENDRALAALSFDSKAAALALANLEQTDLPQPLLDLVRINACLLHLPVGSLLFTVIIVVIFALILFLGLRGIARRAQYRRERHTAHDGGADPRTNTTTKRPRPRTCHTTDSGIQAERIGEGQRVGVRVKIGIDPANRPSWVSRRRWRAPTAAKL